MAESQPTSHTDLMKLRAKGKQLHRRTQSHTTFSLNEVTNKKNNSEEFYQEMLQAHNTPNGDLTQKVLDAVHRQENEKEVIVDDIDEVPNAGIIIPQGFSSGNNPLNGIQRRNLMLRNNFLGNNSQFKKIDMLSQVRNIDDITGLGTIHEKRNSMESIDTENMNKRSPNMSNSGNSSQNISKTVSRAHSKHPSLDFRVGHSNSSSVDFRPMHSKQSSGEMWSLHSKQSSADFKPTHSKQSSADFRPLNKETLGLGARPDKEIDVIKYNLLSPKAVKLNETPQYGANLDYFDKRNRFIADLQKSSIDKLKRESSGTDHISAKVTTSKPDEPKPKSRVNTLERKDKEKEKEKEKEKAKTLKPQTTSKHRRTYSGNIAKAVEVASPREDLTLSAMFLTAKNPRDIGYDSIPVPSSEPQQEIHAAPKKVTMDDSMKKLTTKTDLLEGQIKNIFNIIESFANEKAQLEEKIQTQDQKIKELMSLTNRYQDEIKVLKSKNDHKTGREHERKTTSSKAELGGLNILTSTDGSAFDSSLTESSGFLSNKDSRIKPKPANFSSTPHGQTKFHTLKDERKSPATFGTKSELTKKPSLTAKKPAFKKV